MNGIEPVRESFKTHSRATLEENVESEVRRATRRATKAVVVKVNEEVWAKALTLAEGDYRRIEIVSSTEVCIHNRWVR